MEEATTVSPATERGSVLPLVALWLMALALLAMVLVTTIDVMVRQARAQAAADAGALAGAAEGRSAAALVIDRNAAVLVDYEERQGTSTQSLQVVVVVVEHDGITATAAAERYLDVGADGDVLP